MPHDTRLGIIVGMVLVIAAAVLFFQRESPTQMPPPVPLSAGPAPMPVSLPVARDLPPVPELAPDNAEALPVSRIRQPAPIREAKRVH